MAMYIRTEDGHIYEIKSNGYFVGADERWNLYHHLRQWQLECKQRYAVNAPNGYTTCIKQSDNIEELCDFVDIQYENGDWETYFYEEEFRMKLLFKKAKKVFYGIRTAKGLIYKAEMNEEGGLELL